MNIVNCLSGSRLHLMSNIFLTLLNNDEHSVPTGTENASGFLQKFSPYGALQVSPRFRS
jgi:hypothetical protein